MKMPLTSKLSDFLRGPKDALAIIRDSLHSIARAEAEGIAKRNRVVAQRPNDADALAGLDARLPQMAAVWREQHGPALVAALAGSLDIQPDGSVSGIVTFVSLESAVGPLDLSAAAALFPAELRKGLAEAITAVPDGDGLPLTERVRVAAELAAQIEALREQHANLVDAAAEMGVVLEHLPETQSRRAIAAHRTAREQERVDSFNNANSVAIRAGRLKRAETIDEAR